MSKYPRDSDDKTLKTNWVQIALSVALVLAGLFCTCFCGGLSMYGDYMGPPEGLAESNRQKMNHLMISVAIGVFLIIVGIYGVRKAQKYKD